MQVVVTGIGLISALGNLEITWKQLLSGQSGILPHQPFGELPTKPLALIHSIPSDPTELLETAIADALIMANLTPPLLDCGVVIGSSRGYQGKLEQLARFYPPYPSLLRGGEDTGISLSKFVEYLPFNIALNAAKKIGSTGIILSPMAACSTGIWAIAQGFELIKTQQCQRVIVGAVEAPITPLTLAGFEQMGALANTGCYPFDRDREGFVLGEGATILILESEDLAQQRNAQIYGKILGFGLTADACYGNKPDRVGKSAIAAIQTCLKNSNLSSDEIDYIHTHGTATKLNDDHEVQLIKQLFPQGVSVSSTKGATGHTLGASGALGVAFCLMALKDQLLPPCVGLKTPEFDFDFVTSVRSMVIKNTLCFSFGFGGQNAIIAIGKA
ncbi:beta-ketoacyl-ACP synthase [Planktothrix agardhii]|jgi:3-oxoacyl-[acyl-carrier-protein] synthase II|uniref:3-oxoacyl-[acyl-carrier-protein] synthase 2 n=2 Tax=Planktothrix agardhii TaxID=1160 RepID=A0A073CBQ7_PLAA1|nr:beta-ketoacyl-ACP synthase [Planktothrix agardhii]MCF3608490.1 beta-ketoacyl-ACP synthase [Planktothrix agardhii 1033]BBD54458.1 beta-ketoacyl synthase [Planktothrix agardhii NIES-204]KEI65551.1 3-oxoacyl-[acyl-carrier-protein] synthase 2 [Planktothrix agardhii NIVA-CYA 126/8]MCB8752624.1 beta-ketoacyl-ACP synthase [Planktothrix agardhii 1810]MCB8761654.1 beta-ketoacyl-ACP synthase [Planktothrix agardhii 1813]